MSWLLPLPVAVPLLAAVTVTAGEHMVARRVQDLIGIVAAGGACGLSLLIMLESEGHELLHWYGGWQPRHGVVIGIDFAADPLGAGLAALAAGLVALALIYSFSYLRESSRHYNALMLVFCGAMCGFALSGDLFNIFVWFELMGVAAYALAGFKVKELGPIQGAFNFAIVNTAGAYLMLLGIALLYGRTGALNLAQIGHTLARHHHDPLVGVALTLVLVGFLVKAAVVPFHFWLADAHAVAPAPVCVLFSGVMVELGLYAIARTYWTVFHASTADVSLVGDVLLWVGVATALVGATMCFLERHLKRLLAYSTISHSGVMLAGIGLLGAKGLAGAANMVFSHAFLKGGLFLACGIVLQRLGAIDELKLHARGRGLPGLGVLFALGAIGLIGIPYIGIFQGHSLIDEGASAAGKSWVGPLVMVAAGISAGAILRAGARVFLGWGPDEDDLLTREPGEQPPEREVALAPLYAVVAVMIALGFAASVIPGLADRSEHAAGRFRDTAAYAAQVLQGRPAPGTPPMPYAVPAPTGESVAYGIGAALIALATCGLGLYRRRLPDGIRAAGARVLVPALNGLRSAHTGLIGDYITWLAFGTAALGTIWALALR